MAAQTTYHACVYHQDDPDMLSRDFESCQQAVSWVLSHDSGFVNQGENDPLFRKDDSTMMVRMNTKDNHIYCAAFLTLEQAQNIVQHPDDWIFNRNLAILFQWEGLFGVYFHHASSDYYFCIPRDAEILYSGRATNLKLIQWQPFAQKGQQ